MAKTNLTVWKTYNNDNNIQDKVSKNNDIHLESLNSYLKMHRILENLKWITELYTVISLLTFKVYD